MKDLKLSIIILFTFLITLNTKKCQGSRILGIFPLNGKSHMVMFEQIMKGLARRGHQVDVISTFPQKKPFPNYTDIEIPAAMPKLVNNMTHEFLENVKKSNIVHFLATMAGNLFCEKGFENLSIQNLIKNPPNNPPYDLVVTEVSFTRTYFLFSMTAHIFLLSIFEK